MDQRLSRDRVVTAAVDLLRAEGLKALTMRKLGASLGVEAMSLYRHVPNKDALLSLVRNRLLEDVSVDGAGVGWRGLLTTLARGVFQTLAANPGAAPLFAGCSLAQLAAPETLEKVNRRMKELGFSEALRERALEAVGALILGNVFHAGASMSTFDAGLELLLEGIEGARRWARCDVRVQAHS